MDAEECRREGGQMTDGICATRGELGRRNVARGERFERKILSRLKRSNCIAAMRSVGSRGDWDLVCITPEKVRLIQAKINGYLTPEEREIMLEELKNMPDFIQAEIEYYASPRISHNKTIKKAYERDWCKVKERIDYFNTMRGIQEISPSHGMRRIFQKNG